MWATWDHKLTPELTGRVVKAADIPMFQVPLCYRAYEDVRLPSAFLWISCARIFRGLRWDTIPPTLCGSCFWVTVAFVFLLLISLEACDLSKVKVYHAPHRWPTHLADVDVDEVVVRVDVLSHESPELQKVRQQLPLLLHPRHLLMPVPFIFLPLFEYTGPFALNTI